MEDFEHRYQWYLDMFRDECTLSLYELQTVEAQLRRLNHDLEYADLLTDRRVDLLKLRNETMTEHAAALHHARIDDARAVQRAVASQRPTPEERRRAAARRERTGAGTGDLLASDTP
ncbi:hypothetical protein [Nocardia paucivorans]|uniref:hypothetical protein n=1 Tax=Nocardia paucivorans TaxID=114259 RepID=UPI0002DF49E0|nr:hypothetical protein [Nocardia paucivorans]